MGLCLSVTLKKPGPRRKLDVVLDQMLNLKRPGSKTRRNVGLGQTLTLKEPNHKSRDMSLGLKKK